MNGTRLWLVLALGLVLATGAIAAGCGGDDDEEGDGGGDAETLTVAADIPFPPFGFGKPPDYKGLDIDLVNAIADKIGREVTFERAVFDTIFRDLAQGKYGMVAAATTITPEREETVDFSDPYYLVDVAIVVQEDSDITDVDGLSGATVGVQQGTTEQDYAENETDAAEVRPYPKSPDAINAVRSGQVDAVMLDFPVAQRSVETQSGVKIGARIRTDDVYGLAFREDDDELREQFNEALKELKDDGTYSEIYEKWFNEDPPDEVLTATHEPS